MDYDKIVKLLEQKKKTLNASPENCKIPSFDCLVMMAYFFASSVFFDVFLYSILLFLVVVYFSKNKIHQ